MDLSAPCPFTVDEDRNRARVRAADAGCPPVQNKMATAREGRRGGCCTVTNTPPPPQRSAPPRRSEHILAAFPSDALIAGKLARGDRASGLKLARGSGPIMAICLSTSVDQDCGVFCKTGAPDSRVACVTSSLAPEPRGSRSQMLRGPSNRGVGVPNSGRSARYVSGAHL